MQSVKSHGYNSDLLFFVYSLTQITKYSKEEPFEKGIADTKVFLLLLFRAQLK